MSGGKKPIGDCMKHNGTIIMKIKSFIRAKIIIIVLFSGLLVFSNFFTIFFAASTGNKSSQKSAKLNPTTGEQPPKRKISIGKLKLAKAPEAETRIIMNDPLMHEKWDLKKTNTPSAWRFSKGSRNIVVAVIDTGIDINHPDLKNNIWRNPGEIPDNNKDDDNNGFVDDIHGWNFAGDNNKVYDTHGHGTHIAGIIGAEGGNGIGLSGVAPRVSLMALKYYSPTDNGKNNLNNTIKAIQYAVDNGAHIINYSGGGLEKNKEEKEVIRKAEKKSILFVAAAGNEKSNTDKKGYYPANYQLSNILPVTATDPSDHILKSSNWGKKTVHKSAPGIDILSTIPGAKYGRMTGTSQATAVATGAAVLIMDYYKNKTARFIIKHLKMTGDIKESLQGKTSQRRRLNIFKALQARGIGLNFMDEPVDSSGKTFPFGKDVFSVQQELLEKDIIEMKMVHEILDSKKSNIKTQNKLIKKDPQVREPSSPENKKTPIETEPSHSHSENKKKIPFLKRWFFSR